MLIILYRLFYVHQHFKKGRTFYIQMVSLCHLHQRHNQTESGKCYYVFPPESWDLLCIEGLSQAFRWAVTFHYFVCFFLQQEKSYQPSGRYKEHHHSLCLFFTLRPLQLIAGVQVLIWRCVCEHWLSCSYVEGYQTGRRSLSPPRKVRGSCCCWPDLSCWCGWGIGEGGCCSLKTFWSSPFL